MKSDKADNEGLDYSVDPVNIDQLTIDQLKAKLKRIQRICADLRKKATVDDVGNSMITISEIVGVAQLYKYKASYNDQVTWDVVEKPKNNSKSIFGNFDVSSEDDDSEYSGYNDADPV